MDKKTNIIFFHLCQMANAHHEFPWLIAGRGGGRVASADVEVLASDGTCIPAHYHVLAAASPVMESRLDRPWKRGGSGGGSGGRRVVPILGVPSDAVVSFIGYLYTSKCSEEELDKYGLHLLVLSHVFSIRALKRWCEKGLAARLTADNVVDILQLARLCDAPSLRVRCVKLVAREFAAVEKSEGWRFLQRHDHRLELHLLQSLDEIESQQQRRMRNKKDEKLYLQLSEAMECLEHTFAESCAGVEPKNKETNHGPCKNFSTCRSLQLLLHHFATCKIKAGGGCSHCKRMHQLLKLHSFLCYQPGPCKIPLCGQFKLRMQKEEVGNKEIKKWKLLARKVISAKAMSSLAKRKRGEVDKAPWMIGGNGSFNFRNQSIN